jgi:hypothetical protein
LLALPVAAAPAARLTSPGRLFGSSARGACRGQGGAPEVEPGERGDQRQRRAPVGLDRGALAGGRVFDGPAGDGERAVRADLDDQPRWLEPASAALAGGGVHHEPRGAGAGQVRQAAAAQGGDGGIIVAGLVGPRGAGRAHASSRREEARPGGATAHHHHVTAGGRAAAGANAASVREVSGGHATERAQRSAAGRLAPLLRCRTVAARVSAEATAAAVRGAGPPVLAAGATGRKAILWRRSTAEGRVVPRAPRSVATTVGPDIHRSIRGEVGQIPVGRAGVGGKGSGAEAVSRQYRHQKGLVQSVSHHFHPVTPTEKHMSGHVGGQPRGVRWSTGTASSFSRPTLSAGAGLRERPALLACPQPARPEQSTGLKAS